MDTQALHAAGLSEGETKVYLALLELGDSTTGPVIKASGVSRSIVSLILEKLSQKGLVSVIVKEKTHYYQAHPPQSLMDVLQTQEETLAITRNSIQAMLPQLMLMQQHAPKSEIRVFHGFKGLITVHEHLYERLHEGDEYFYMGIDEQPQFFHSYWKKDHMRRAKAKIKCKLLFNEKIPISVLQDRNSYLGCDARYMPKGINPPAWFMSYNGVAAISIPADKPLTVEMVNPEIAKAFQIYFQQIWNLTKPIKDAYSK